MGSQLAREEMEQLLRIANYQLNLAHDPDTALAALQEADAVLARLADPGLQPLRRQLSDDILALRSVERVDIEGIALRLDSLARRVDQLPLNADAAELRRTRRGGTGQRRLGSLPAESLRVPRRHIRRAPHREQSGAAAVARGSVFPPP